MTSSVDSGSSLYAWQVDSYLEQSCLWLSGQILAVQLFEFRV